MNYSLLNLRMNQIILDQETQISNLLASNSTLKSKIAILDARKMAAIKGGKKCEKQNQPG